jgi:hypothetical protein
MKQQMAFGAGLMAGICGLVWAIGACSDSKTKNDGGGSDSGFVTCHENMLVPGTYPDPTCDPGAIDNSCTAGAGKCTIDGKCGSPDTCLPLSDNGTKTVLDFRMRKLNVVAPQSLAGLQKIVIDKGVLLNTCADKADGTFSWLLRVDKTANTLMTGGSPPVGMPIDPFQPYCFYRQKVNGLDVKPVTVPITFNGNTFQTGDGALQQLNIPIFILGNPVPVILPVRGAKINSATIDPNNCIGHFQKDGLDNNCVEIDPATCPKWRPNGSLGGYITLEDADKVDVRETNKTLCAQLTGDVTGGMVDIGGGVMIAHCGRTAGKLTAKGDYCEGTKSAGGCQDAFWLAATFAASAAKIDDPGTNPLCMMGASDAGGD